MPTHSCSSLTTRTPAAMPFFGESPVLVASRDADSRYAGTGYSALVEMSDFRCPWLATALADPFLKGGDAREWHFSEDNAKRAEASAYHPVPPHSRMHEQRKSIIISIHAFVCR